MSKLFITRQTLVWLKKKQILDPVYLMLSPLWSNVKGTSEWWKAETYLCIWMPLKGTKTADWGNLCVCARMQRFFSGPVQQKGPIRVPLKTTWMSWRLITSPGPVYAFFHLREVCWQFSEHVFSFSCYVKVVDKNPFQFILSKVPRAKKCPKCHGISPFLKPLFK